MCCLLGASALGDNPLDDFLIGLLAYLLANVAFQFFHLTFLPKKIYAACRKQHPFPAKVEFEKGVIERGFYDFAETPRKLTSDFFGSNVFNLFAADSEALKKEWFGFAGQTPNPFSGKTKKILVRFLNESLSKAFAPQRARIKQKYMFACGIWYVGTISLVFRLFGRNGSIKRINAAAAIFSLCYLSFLVGTLIVFCGFLILDMTTIASPAAFHEFVMFVKFASWVFVISLVLANALFVFGFGSILSVFSRRQLRKILFRA